MIEDWGRYPNFSRDEFACQHCGDEDMDTDFMDALQELRTTYGKPITITSGYRCPAHPIEASKIERGGRPGSHASGCAADIGVSRAAAVEILRLALNGPFTGFGVQQKGSGRFLHLDNLTTNRPAIWSY